MTAFCAATDVAIKAQSATSRNRLFIISVLINGMQGGRMSPSVPLEPLPALRPSLARAACYPALPDHPGH